MLAPTTNGIGTSDNVDDALVVVTLGVTTDELYDFAHRDATMYVPAMGTITPVSLGLALAYRIGVALDSDGSLLLSLGSLTQVGSQAPKTSA